MQNSEKHSEKALRLIVTGERMFADHGLEGVSLRQISAAAKNTNNYAVQHHFGSKQSFLQAIYDRWVPTLERSARRRLRAVDKAGPVSVRELLEVILLSILDVVDEHGELTYARFLARLMYVKPTQHPAHTSTIPLPTYADVNQRLHTLLADLPNELFELRLRLVSSTFLFSVAEHSNLNLVLSRPVSRSRYISNALDMAAAALTASFGTKVTKAARMSVPRAKRPAGRLDRQRQVGQ